MSKLNLRENELLS